MVTDTEGYIHIIEYLTEHFSLFENSSSVSADSDTVMSVIEQELSEQIISILISAILLFEKLMLLFMI